MASSFSSSSMDPSDRSATKRGELEPSLFISFRLEEGSHAEHKQRSSSSSNQAGKQQTASSMLPVHDNGDQSGARIRRASRIIVDIDIDSIGLEQLLITEGQGDALWVQQRSREPQGVHGRQGLLLGRLLLRRDGQH